MSALPIAAVALDKDGVTFDSERIYADALLSTLRALPKPYPEPEALAARCSGESSTATATGRTFKGGARRCGGYEGVFCRLVCAARCHD